MKSTRVYQWLSRALGAVVAQLFCWAMLLAMFGLAVRSFVWLDNRTSGGIDPVHFILVIALGLIAIQIWRFFSSADLDE